MKPSLSTPTRAAWIYESSFDGYRLLERWSKVFKKDPAPLKAKTVEQRASLPAG
ncbi:MAG: hypothetical protein JO334_18280 [Verrucomicrobia bacterium]|nr:hypothetical protein [Verrucomicrobiota bacterium]